METTTVVQTVNVNSFESIIHTNHIIIQTDCTDFFDLQLAVSPIYSTND